MSLSYVTYTSDGSTPNFAVPFDYIAKGHVTVTKNDVSAAFTWTSGSVINVSGGVINGDVIVIRRTTPKNSLATSSDGSVLTNSVLTTMAKQSIFLSEESLDAANDVATLITEQFVVYSEDAQAAAVSATASASTATTAAATAVAAAAAAATSFDSFDDRYLGAKASAPTLDNDGNALTDGALYSDTVLLKMRVWTAGAWADVAAGISQAAADIRYGRLGVSFTNAWAGINNFFGDTTVPTKSQADNSFAVANTSYVDTAKAAAISAAASATTAAIAAIPGPPAFRVTADGVGAAGALGKMTTASAVFNNGGYWNNSTKRFTPPAGFYTFSLSLKAAVSNSTNTIHLYKNGAAIASASDGNSGSWVLTQTISIDDQANGTDYYEAYWAGSSLSVPTAADAWFSAFGHR